MTYCTFHICVYWTATAVLLHVATVSLSDQRNLHLPSTTHRPPTPTTARAEFDPTAPMYLRSEVHAPRDGMHEPSSLPGTPNDRKARQGKDGSEAKQNGMRPKRRSERSAFSPLPSSSPFCCSGATINQSLVRTFKRSVWLTNAKAKYLPPPRPTNATHKHSARRLCPLSPSTGHQPRRALSSKGGGTGRALNISSYTIRRAGILYLNSQRLALKPPFARAV